MQLELPLIAPRSSLKVPSRSKITIEFTNGPISPILFITTQVTLLIQLVEINNRRFRGFFRNFEEKDIS